MVAVGQSICRPDSRPSSACACSSVWLCQTR